MKNIDVIVEASKHRGSLQAAWKLSSQHTIRVIRSVSAHV